MCVKRTSVSPRNEISCNSGQSMQFLSIFGECGSFLVLDKSVRA